MAETQNTNTDGDINTDEDINIVKVDLESLFRMNILNFKEKLSQLNLETLKFIQSILQETKNDRNKETTFYKKYGNKTGITQRMVLISTALLNLTKEVKSNVNKVLRSRS